MGRGRLRLRTADGAALRRRFEQARADLGVPEDFPDDVLRAAQEAAARVPDAHADLRDVPFVTIDPPGSTDLDQAVRLVRDGDGHRLDYAIADVPFVVDPDGPVAREALRRGQTLYAPDRRTPLHPPVLSEDAASLLPDRDRPALVWRFRLDGAGEVADVVLVRALVRSRARLDYAGVQARADALPGPDLPGDPAGDVAVLQREVGTRRAALERARGGAALPLPDQEVEADGDTWTIRLRPGLPAEDWNAQVSLMTGMAAARIMLDGGVGILRTMPAPDAGAVAAFRRQAQALGTAWPADETYGAFLDRLDPARPEHLALLHEAASLFRGAGYTPFDGAPPDAPEHAAVAAPYAHVTAPLRRLVDRHALACCLALTWGEPVRGWVRDGLPALPDAMRASDALAGELERRCLDAVEHAVVSARPGEVFDAVVVDVGKDGGDGGGRVQVADPPVLARCAGPVRLSARVRVRADPDALARDEVRLVPVAAAESPAPGG